MFHISWFINQSPLKFPRVKDRIVNYKAKVWPAEGKSRSTPVSPLDFDTKRL